MIDAIRELERQSRRLDPPPDERRRWHEAVRAYTDRFLDRLDDLPVWVSDPDLGAGIRTAAITDEAAGIGDLLDLIGRHVDPPGINPASGGHLGYIPGGGLVPSAFGDFLAAVTNKYAGIFFAAPGAVRMENLLLDWMAGLVGYPVPATGNLTSGGSIGNLIGIVTARDAQGVRAADVPRAVIYLTSHVHHSVAKAIRIAGLGEAIVRHVPMDGRHRMDADALDALVSADAAGGRRPFLVIASAGTTDVGAVDPLEAIADVARRHGLWYHVDGAYGAFFALCEGCRPILAGMDLSDSIVMDPHKGLFLPYGSGAVLVKDGAALRAAHAFAAHYMQDTLGTRDEVSPADVSPELTRPFRGLRLWLPLKLFGLAPFRAALEEKLLLARYFRARLLERPGFDVGPEPDLSVVTFRYVPAALDADAFNEALVSYVREDGRVFLSSSMIDGRYTIRLAVLAFRTHLDDIEAALDVLSRGVAALDPGAVRL